MKKNCFFLLAVFLFQTHFSFSQAPKPISKTKLVIGIVVDQMRNDFISRYWDRFGEGGFKRLVNNGFYFKNTHYNYIPTYTGPGHSSIYTGTTPRYHGIIGNDWFIKKNFSYTYCTQDSSVRTVGSDSKNGMASPKNQLSPTIGDELKMRFGQNSKVFGVALKDRSAIFPAGHAADGAFWFDDASGNFISSTWYLKALPQWLNSFNAKKMAISYLQKGWSPLYSLQTYTNSIGDDNRYEGAPFKEKAVFPYEFKSYLDKNAPGIIKATPYGNSITRDVAIECLKNEQLGKDAFPDLFCISFSSTDIVAHSFGPRAIETEDVYLRLDKDIEELLNALDKEVGKNNYVVFLTADHGASDVPNHLLDNKIPGGYLNEKKIEKQLKEFFRSNYGDTLLLANLSNEQVFLNEPLLYIMKLSKEEVEERLCKFLITVEGVAEAFPSNVMRNGSFERSDIRALLQNGYNHKLSGNVCYTYKPGWMDYSEKGTTHGTGYNYDTHVPLLFYGNGIKKGSTHNYVTITQIAPTVCELIDINQPGTSFSEPLNDYFKE